MALLGCAEPALQRLILVEPILNADHAIWQSPASVTLRAALRRVGMKPVHTAPHLRLVCPTLLEPQTPTDKIILIAGEYDRIASPGQIRELHQAWAGSHYSCHPQGHVGYTLMPESFRIAQKTWPDDFQAPVGAAAPDLTLAH